ncbi:MAG: DUF1194 domain-containing protein [Rhizobiaceae bacterium]
MLETATLALCIACGAPIDRPGVAEVDVELVLAVDVSRSMDPSELVLQRAGYAAALRHPDVLDAIRRSARGRIALTYFEWAGGIETGSIVGWRIIDGPASAEAFASEIESRVADSRFGTSISGAIDHAAGLFDGNGIESPRRVVDVSGDGPNNDGRAVTLARDAAVSAGIVVNGLPILINPSRTFRELDRYYAECVMGGPGAFVLPVYDQGELSIAIRRKLVLEISGLEPDASTMPAAARRPIDCTAGERDQRFQPAINVPPSDW